MKRIKNLKSIKEIEEEKLKAEFESLLVKQRLMLRWLIIKLELSPERLLSSVITSFLFRIKKNSEEKESQESTTP
jgi:hypothetical protein